ncbi:MAG: hypothetical protein AB1442_15765 [Nitrospirota bacterium]
MSQKRCTRCVLPETYPGIDFDANGVCQLCRAYQRPTVRGVEELKRLVGSGKGNKYDCAVTLSGGRDSTYVLYYAARILGLRILAFSYDNGFRHVQALKNIRRACTLLGVDLLESRSRDNLNARITARALHTTIPFGPGAACQLMCRPCYNGGLAFLYSIAEEYGIPFILWGDSVMEKISFIPVRDRLLGFQKPRRYLLSARGFSFIRFLQLLISQRNERLPSGNSRFDARYPKLRNPGIQEIHLFDYIEWDRREIKRAITEELDWQKPAEKISTWRFDCHLHGLVNYCHKKAVGFNHDIDGLANMIRAGKMDRSEAMDLIAKGFDSDEWNEELDYLVRETLNLPESDIMALKSW